MNPNLDLRKFSIVVVIATLSAVSAFVWWAFQPSGHPIMKAQPMTPENAALFARLAEHPELMLDSSYVDIGPDRVRVLKDTEGAQEFAKGYLEYEPVVVGDSLYFLRRNEYAPTDTRSSKRISYSLMRKPLSDGSVAQHVSPLLNGRPAGWRPWRWVAGPVLARDGVLRLAVCDDGQSWLVEVRAGGEAEGRPITLAGGDSPSPLLHLLTTGSTGTASK